MKTQASRLLLACLAICVLSSAAEAKDGSKRRRESRESSKASESKREGKIKACEASPTKYWDYFSKRCLPIPK